MSNVLIVTADWSDAATLSGGDAVAGYPVSNLQKQQPGDLWKASVVSTTIIADRGLESAPFNFIGLLYSNLTSVAVWQILASNDPAFPGNPGDYDSGAVTAIGSPTLTTPTRRHGFVLPSSANMNFRLEGYTLGGGGGLTRRYVSIEILNLGGNNIQAGRLIIGQAYQPTKNYSYGANPFGIEDPATVTEAASGQRIPRSGVTKRKTCRFTLGLVDKTETYNNLPAIMETCGGSDDVLVVLDPAEATHVERMMFYGTLAARQNITNTNFDVYEQVFEVTELP